MHTGVLANSGLQIATAMAATALFSCFGDGSPAVDFAKDVQPILRERCVECQGPAQQRAASR
jgi:hypothetical protein